MSKTGPRSSENLADALDMEVIMPAHSSMHFYLNWAKERIDEMDAVLASFETKASEVQADSRAKADQFVVDLKKKRDEFQQSINKQADAGEAAWSSAKSQMETTWKGFEAEVKKYVETFGKQIDQQHATFHGAATAQLKAWRDAAEKIQSAAAELATDRRNDIDAENEGRRLRSGGKFAKAEACGRGILGRFEWRPGRVACGF
jgi:hypothetical protein